MRKMLVLVIHPGIERHLPEIIEIGKTHGIAKVLLAKVSPAIGSGARGATALHKLDTAARMSDAAASEYLSRIAGALREEGIDCEPIGTSIPAKRLDVFIEKNHIDLVLAGDERSGLYRWHGAGLVGSDLQSILGLAEEVTAVERRAEAGGGFKIMSGAVLQFGALFLFWLVLSGRYQLKYILFGVASAALVTFLTNGLFSAIFHCEETDDDRTIPSVLKLLRFLAYMPWLLYQIIKANIQVASIVLNPRMPIEPVLFQFSTRLKRKVAQVILANSITLTPGTVTISLDNGRYTVHALVPASAQDLVEARMQNKIGEIFMEKKEPPPETLWAHSIGELAQ